jgi:RNase P subunit RPR2
MKTISGPVCPEWTPIRVTCKNCEAVLELDEIADVQGDDDQRDGTYFWFVCPHCEYTGQLQPGLIHKRFKKDILQRPVQQG